MVSKIITNVDDLAKAFNQLPPLNDRGDFLDRLLYMQRNGVTNKLSPGFNCGCGDFHSQIPFDEEGSILGYYESNDLLARWAYKTKSDHLLYSCKKNVVSALVPQGIYKKAKVVWHTNKKVLEDLISNFPVASNIWRGPIVKSNLEEDDYF